VARKIEWTQKARDDLRGIYHFIAQDSKRYAQIQVEKIQNSISYLADSPLMGRTIPEFPHLPYRELLSGNYRALYRYDEKQDRILILAVVHGKRLLREEDFI